MASDEERHTSIRSGLSKWERDELKTERRKLLTKFELKREVIAERLRCPLCFSLPCAIIALMLLILMGIFIVQPHQVGRTLQKTICRYNRTELLGVTGDCSHRTDPFSCIRIYIHFNTSSIINHEAVLMENEKSLVHCNKCSFTNGMSDLFGRRTTCSWNADLDSNACFAAYMGKFASENASYLCYYDPENLDSVARTLEVTEAEAAMAICLPLLVVVLWVAAFAFLLYDRYKRRYSVLVLGLSMTKFFLRDTMVVRETENLETDEQASLQTIFP
ncbi:uncharacterized protein LOC5519034 isoform X2 [Nematostella vectensis]|uniref:uncharacterized protein LOC5519034 isoform X2 n=1 Tax=Nematostella vectensis TaxID=45351 RepID=UPI00138FABF5|nr:uncharacterized protein LOC5519034 isoform X2 [Nematostella vectensis]